MSDESMVERVAKAIRTARVTVDGNTLTAHPTSGALGIKGDPLAEAMARAAIKAMHEPTEAIKVAGVNAYEGEGATMVRQKIGSLAEVHAGNAWRAMIDEALK